MKKIERYEYDSLIIDDKSFTRDHWSALLKLNEFHNNKYFQVKHNGIRFQQFVGVIQVDGLSIEIHPKADRYSEKSNWRNVLLQMLHKCSHLKAQSTGTASVNRQHLNLLEVYFELYLNEVAGLIRRGLVKQYRTEKGNVKALKGKLEFAGNIKHNLIHKERFFTTHQVYDHNNLIHQTLKKALDIVEHFTLGTKLHDFSCRTLMSFPPVTSKLITQQLLDSISLNRKTQPYFYALELARLIILNYSPDISTGRERMLSLLFDMNELWEEYVLVELRKACKDSNISVSGQESKKFWGYNGLRPDVVLREKINGTVNTYVVDTKWKQPLDSNASVQDLRQMYTYGRFWKAEKVMLLYPGTNNERDFIPYNNIDFSLITDEIHPDKIIHICKMGFVSVIDMEKGGLKENLGDEILKLLGIQKITSLKA